MVHPHSPLTASFTVLGSQVVNMNLCLGEPASTRQPTPPTLHLKQRLHLRGGPRAAFPSPGDSIRPAPEGRAWGVLRLVRILARPPQQVASFVTP